MDGSRFDEMTRRLSGTASRRWAIGLLAGVLGGALVVGDAAAGLGPRRGVCRPIGAGCTRGAQCCSEQCATSRALPRRHRNRCACPAGFAGCDGACVDTQTDVANCGACGEVCGSSGEVCVSGVCESAWNCTTYAADQLPGIHYCFDIFGGDSIAMREPCGITLFGATCTSADDCPSGAGDNTAVCTRGWVACDGSVGCKSYNPQGDGSAGTCAYGRTYEYCV